MIDNPGPDNSEDSTYLTQAAEAEINAWWDQFYDDLNEAIIGEEEA